MKQRFQVALLFSLVSLQAIAGSTYKWVDSEGKVHYGDAPPAQGKVLNRSNAPSAPAGDEEYCQGLQRVSVVIANAMQMGTPAEEVSSALRSAEVATGEIFRIDSAVQQQLVGYIYSFKAYRSSSTTTIAENVRSRCLNGVYASPIKPRQATEP